MRVRDGERARLAPDQHRVVEAGAAGRRRDQILALQMESAAGQGSPPPHPSRPRRPPHWHLQHYVGARFDIQDPRGPKWLEAGVGVVGEGGPVEGTGRLHMVQQEAELVRVLTLGLRLGPPQEDARGLTQHGGVVDHLARLWGQRWAAQHVRPQQAEGQGWDGGSWHSRWWSRCLGTWPGPGAPGPSAGGSHSR